MIPIHRGQHSDDRGQFSHRRFLGLTRRCLCQACFAYRRARRADRIVAEVNNGGEMMASEQLTYFGCGREPPLLATCEKCPTPAVGHPILFLTEFPERLVSDSITY